jgi:RND family efflux transporter MFP subunit
MNTPMRAFGSLIFLFCVVLSFLGITGMDLLDKQEEKASEAFLKNVLPVKVRPVHFEESYPLDYVFLGRVFTRRHSALGFEQSGLIREIRVDEGEPVVENQVLALLDTTLLEAEIRGLQVQKKQASVLLTEKKRGARPEKIQEAQARVEQVEARIKLAKREKERMEQLTSEKIASIQGLDQATSLLDALKAEQRVAQEVLNELIAGTRQEQIEAQETAIEGIQAQIDILEIQKDKAQLKAPFAGVLSSRKSDEGQVVQAGVPVFEVIETAHLEVRFGMAGAILSQLVPEKGYEIFVEKRPYQAQFKSWIPQRNSKTRLVTAIFTLSEASKSVRSGDLASFHFSLPVSERVCRLPLCALTEGVKGLWACYLAEKEVSSDLKERYQVVKRPVEVLHVSGDEVYVRGVLQEGEKVIIEGIQRLSPGQSVSIP